MSIDTQQLRMQYEILNKPIEDIALEAKLPLETLQNVANSGNWKQWFPEPDLVLSEDDTSVTTDEMEEQSQEFTTRTKQRLAMYNITKDLLLAQKYLALEIKIIDEANLVLDASNLQAKDVKSLSSLYAEMTKSSIRDALASFSFGEDGNGLPTVIFKDMSGQGSK